MVRLTARWRALTRSLWPSAVLGQPQSRPVGGALRHTGFGPHTRDASRLVLEHLVDRYRCFPFSVIVHHRAKMSWQSDQTAGQPKDTGVRSWSKIDSYTLWHAVAKLEADKKGAHNRATGEARAAAAASGTLPLDYMLGIMRDPAADHKRRDAMAMAAAPYLHPRLTAIDAKLNPPAHSGRPRNSCCLAHPASCQRRSGVRPSRDPTT